jgi:hypothetical protein
MERLFFGEKSRLCVLAIASNRFAPCYLPGSFSRANPFIPDAMKRNLLFLILFGLLSGLSAQLLTERVLIANGGEFFNPNLNVSLTSWDPQTGQLQVLDTVLSSSVQDLLVEGNTAYLAAQDSIIRYELPSGRRLAAAAFGAPSTAKLALYGDFLLVGNWYGRSSSNLLFFDKTSLSLVDSIPQVRQGARDFVIVGDTAYVGQNYTNQFFGDSAGYLSLVDLTNRQWVRDVALDPADGLGRVVAYQGIVYGLNPNNETITRYEVRSGQVLPKQFTGIDLQTGTVGPQLVQRDSLVITEMNNGIGVFDLKNNRVVDTTLIDTFATAFVQDSLSGHFYLTQTDFSTYSQGRIFDGNGNRQGSFPTGVAPEALAVVYNFRPLAQNDAGFTPADSLLRLDLLANDQDDDSLRAELVDMPGQGLASIQQGLLSYTPDPGFVGFERFRYRAIDRWGRSDTAEVQLEVGNVSAPAAPLAFGLERVFFSTGGNFLAPGNQVIASFYDPNTRQIVPVDSQPGDFSNDVLVDGQFLYLHVGRSASNPQGKDEIFKYDAVDKQRVDDIRNVPGVQQMLIHEDWLILNRGFGADSNYVLIFDKNDMGAGPLYRDQGIPTETQRMVVVGEKLYVSFNQADTARLGVIDLSGGQIAFDQVISLDTLAANLGQLFTDGENIYGLSEKVLFPPPSFQPVVVNAGVTRFEPATQSWQTFPTPRANSGIGLADGKLYANFGQGIGSFAIDGSNQLVNPIFPTAYTAGVRDSLSGKFFYQNTDFFSFGELNAVDSVGDFRLQFPTDLSGTAIALAYNHAPQANDDNQLIALLTPSRVDVLANDQEPDGDTLALEIVRVGSSATAQIVGRQIEYTASDPIDNGLTYRITDPWGRTDTARVNFDIVMMSLEASIDVPQVSLFPNPVRQQLHLQLEEAPRAPLELRIWDAQGRLVMGRKGMRGKSWQLPVQALPAGRYQLQLKGEDNIWQAPFLKVE